MELQICHIQFLGLRKFWNSNFYIDETVLDPRPESELIVEKVLELSDTNLSLIDLGTGSGCLAISIALERPNFKILIKKRFLRKTL